LIVITISYSEFNGVYPVTLCPREIVQPAEIRYHEKKSNAALMRDLRASVSRFAERGFLLQTGCRERLLYCSD
jgi:hypothetical protein